MVEKDKDRDTSARTYCLGRKGRRFAKVPMERF